MAEMQDPTVLDIYLQEFTIMSRKVFIDKDK